MRLANKSDDVDLADYFEFTADERAEIGMELIRSGQRFTREHKANGSASVHQNTTDIYFAGSNDGKSNNLITHATVTARPTSEVLSAKDDMPALGLNLGWQAVAEDSMINDLNILFTAER